MAYEYMMLDGAKKDFEAIVEYLLGVSDGPSAALEFIDEYERRISLVRENPLLYRVSRMPELAELGYRVALVRNYVALYFFRDETVFVAHIFHQRQDYAKLV